MAINPHDINRTQKVELVSLDYLEDIAVDDMNPLEILLQEEEENSWYENIPSTFVYKHCLSI